MAVASNVQVKDRGWDKIVDTLKGLVKVEVAVGIQGDKAAADHDGLTNAELGAIHEWGSLDKTKPGFTPERSWLRSTVAEKQSEIQKAQAEIARKRVYMGQNPMADIRMMGEDVRAAIVYKIKSGIEPELADSTKAARGGSDTPLWHTGQLANSITSEIRPEGSGD